MAAFKVGDLVVLKSGGPVMTVSDVDGDGVWCDWFAGKKREHAHFKANTLVPAPKDPPVPSK